MLLPHTLTSCDPGVLKLTWGTQRHTVWVPRGFVCTCFDQFYIFLSITTMIDTKYLLCTISSSVLNLSHSKWGYWGCWHQFSAISRMAWVSFWSSGEGLDHKPMASRNPDEVSMFKGLGSCPLLAGNKDSLEKGCTWKILFEEWVFHALAGPHSAS